MDAEFYVDHAGFIDGRYSLLGRTGGTVRVGDRFTLVRRYVRPTKFEDYIRSMPVESERPTEAEVVLIHAYNKEFTEIGPGLTALLTVRTDDAFESDDVLVKTS